MTPLRNPTAGISVLSKESVRRNLGTRLVFSSSTLAILLATSGRMGIRNLKDRLSFLPFEARGLNVI